MEQLKTMKEQLTSMVQGQMGDIKSVDAKELGEAVDMIKDLAEAIYYCTITEAMEENEKKEKYQSTEPRYYTMYPQEYYRDMDKGRMYYGGDVGMGSYDQGQSGIRGGRRNYQNQDWDFMSVPVHDYREGRSPRSRKNYMESKEMHQDKATQMKELETYMQELSQDITEMIQDATPEEKQILRNKLNMLSEKIK